MRNTEHRLRSFAFQLVAATVLIGIVLSSCSRGTPSTTSDIVIKDAATPQLPATTTPIPPTTEPEPSIDLDGTYWILVSYVDDQGDTVAMLPDTVIDAEFTADQITGFAGCNHYFADYQLDGAALVLGPVGATRMACGEAIDNQEMMVLTALGSAVAYQVTGDQLQIVDADGVILLTFAKAEATEDTTAAQAWTVDVLKNTAYTIEDLGEVRLVNGEYQHQYGDGATMFYKVSVADVTLGDLDGDSNDDAAVVLVWQSGGSGTFLYLTAVHNENGVPQQAAINALGDRVQPGDLTITDGVIALEVLTHGPDDPMCCPSQKAVQTYALEGDVLTLVSSEAVGPELVGTVWLWEELDDTSGKSNIVVDDPSHYSLEFLADGTYNLQADCNQGSGTYTLDGSSLTLSPGPMTMVACAPGSLYDEFVTRLGDVTNFTFYAGTLALNLNMDAGTMVFAKTE